MEFKGQIFKTFEEQRLAYGWLYVTEENGERMIDHSGEFIEEDELAKAAHKYMLDSRKGKILHQGKAIADIVESMVFTKELQKILGIDLKKSGWVVGYKVHDDEAWSKIKSGEFKMLSIGGRSRKVPVDV